ncbi:MAG: hypothetical protein K2R98_07580 [Gemmataceae bacterium]|nr:hypothetical protein [Gemmataceae bacterium]
MADQHRPSVPSPAAPGPVVFRDTTLREGIQIPGSRVTLEQKREFIALLDSVGVAEVEIGLPDSVSACAEVANLVRGHGPTLRPTALVPCYTSRWQRQVDMAAETGIHRIDILTPTSDQLLADPSHYGMQASDILSRVAQVAEYTRKTRLAFSVAFMDATRAPRDRILALARRMGGLGATRLTVYDSIGCMVASRMTALVREVRDAAGLPILVHCHNDYGMATANTLAAVEGGAEAMDVAVNGLGGRAGNAALEEVALALENLYQMRTGIRTELLKQLSELAERMTGLANWPLKPVVGDFCFAHVPVMHIRCIAGGNPSAFEPYDPRQVGAERKFDFSLPVDYSTAVEPFIRKSGCALERPAVERLLAQLQAREGRTGWSEQEILQLTRTIAGKP